MHTVMRTGNSRRSSKLLFVPGRPKACTRNIVRAFSNHTENSSSSSGAKKSPSSSSGSSLMGTMADSLASLRWRATTALASSLKGDEVELLLQKLDAVPNKTVQAQQQRQGKEEAETGLKMSMTIGEAVAAARAQETQMNATRWGKERTVLLQQAEEAAVARVNSDLSIQERRIVMKQRQQELEVEKNRVSAAAKREEEEQQQQQEPIVKPIAIHDHSQLHHPVLGPVLVDLGHKRVHIVSAKALAAIPIWKKQRIYRHERAKVMANDKTKTFELGLPGIIALYEDENGKLSILDGQHRFGMMMILLNEQTTVQAQSEQETEIKSSAETNKNDGDDSKVATSATVATSPVFDLDRILVEVFPHVNSMKHPNETGHENDEGGSATQPDITVFGAQDIFLEINKAEPVKLVDMPGVASAAHRTIITQAAANLAETYPEMFKPSQRCRAPHMNIDNLRDALFASDVLKRHHPKLKSQKALYEWILTQNDALKIKFCGKIESSTPTPSTSASSFEEQQKEGSVNKAALKKAVQHDFFLGLESSWFYK